MSNFPVISPGSPLLHTWVVPGANRRITLRHGSVGMVLIYMASYFDEHVEKLDSPGREPVDEGGYNHRRLTGSKTVWSEHAKGTAEDLNWARHGYGIPANRTFTARQVKLIHKRMGWLNRVAGATVLIWGGDWPSHPGSSAKPDAMHFEISGSMKNIERLARLLSHTPRGKKILAANPGQRAVIYS